MIPSKPNRSSSRSRSSVFCRLRRMASAAFSQTARSRVVRDRLFEEVERPLLHRLDGLGDGGVAGDQDHLGVGQRLPARARISMPSTSFITRSVTTMSNVSVSIFRAPSGPLVATTHS